MYSVGDSDDVLAGAEHAVGVVVHHEVGALVHRRRAVAGAGAAQHGLGPGHELLEAERLLQVVVAAEREPADLVLGGVAGGQEQHRRAVAACTQPAAHLEPVEVGHHHVEHHEVGPLRRDHVERRPAVLGGGDLEAVVLQRGGEHRAQVLLVVDDEEVLSGHGTSVTLLPGSSL